VTYSAFVVGAESRFHRQSTQYIRTPTNGAETTTASRYNAAAALSASEKVIFRPSYRRIPNTKSKRTTTILRSDSLSTHIDQTYRRSFEEFAETELRKSVVCDDAEEKRRHERRLKIAHTGTAIKFAGERRYGQRSEAARRKNGR